ncbi:MAG: DUF4124 domain-containing protein [Azonexus sp.]|nr:DUF4124 domain-containing protein [Azonexus sp.]MCK6413390.1 DUF4124 domain-containing protein [Azonexus sp.]
MKSVKLLFRVLLVSTVFVVTLASGQTYQWKDAGGRTVISDAPPPRSTPSRSVATPVVERGDLAEREMEFRKRRKEAQEKSEKAEKEAAHSAQRREICERARQALAAFESGREISGIDERGEQAPMDAAARMQESERLRGIVAENCK